MNPEILQIDIPEIKNQIEKADNSEQTETTKTVEIFPEIQEELDTEKLLAELSDLQNKAFHIKRDTLEEDSKITDAEDIQRLETILLTMNM